MDKDELTPEELRKEIFESILKKRIFYSDRIEKIEKVLISMNLINKEQIYCSHSDLQTFINNLHSD